MDLSLSDVLKSLNLDKEFSQKSISSIKEAKEGAWDKSIFEEENKEKFIKHYSDEIFSSFEGTDNINADDFLNMAIENGFIEEDFAAGFQSIIDKNGDNKFSKEEINELLDYAFDEYIDSMGPGEPTQIPEPDEPTIADEPTSPTTSTKTKTTKPTTSPTLTPTDEPIIDDEPTSPTTSTKTKTTKPTTSPTLTPTDEPIIDDEPTSPTTSTKTKTTKPTTSPTASLYPTSPTAPPTRRTLEN